MRTRSNISSLESFVSPDIQRVKGNTCCTFMMDPKEVPRTQFSNANSKDTIAQSVKTHVLRYPMNAETGTNAFAVEEYASEASMNSSIIWKEEIEDSIRSAVGFLQIILVKSQTSLLDSSYLLYPIYVSLLSFTEQVVRRSFVAGSALVAYIPMAYRDSGSANTQRNIQIMSMPTLH